MDSLTVRELTKIARECGLKGYSRLRKADLVKLLEQHASTHPPRGVVNFIDEPPRERQQPSPSPPIHRPPKAKPYQIKSKQTRRQKREEKNFEAPSPVQLVNDKAKDKQIKRIKKKLRKLNKKKSREVITKRRRLHKALEKIKSKPHELESFKLEESKSALKKLATQYTIDGVKGYDPKTFLSAVKPTVNRFLNEHRNIKFKMILKCTMSKTNVATGEVEYTTAHFVSLVEIILQGTNLDNLYQRMTDKVLESLAAFQMRGSNWIFESIDVLELHTVKYEPLNGSSYIPLPKALSNKKAIINMKNDDDECFKWCVTRALNPVSRDGERITKILRKQSEKLNWDGIKFPLELGKIDRFEKQNKS